MEKVLDCGCHKITTHGDILSRIEQFSMKGHQGIITRVGQVWKKMHPTKTEKGYYQVAIHGRSVRVNRLVASNFIPNPMAYPEVQHKDDIKSHNQASNLKWGNQRHNAEDREKNSHSVHGSHSPNAKLTEDNVREIRRIRPQTTLAKIAQKYGVSKKLILLVVQGKIWRHVK